VVANVAADVQIAQCALDVVVAHNAIVAILTKDRQRKNVAEVDAAIKGPRPLKPPLPANAVTGRRPVRQACSAKTCIIIKEYFYDYKIQLPNLKF